MEQPPWLSAAWAELGVHEIPGSASEPEILRYFREAGDTSVASEDTPWCAAFAGAMLRRSGYPGTGSLLARSYLGWGTALDSPRLGAVTVLSRGQDPTLGHVGFYVGETADKLFLLGGNQGQAVTVAACDRARLLAFRWPSEEAPPPLDAASEATFAKSLSHVLEMEGGYSNDPYDPGGPTNRGITLAEYARFRNETLDQTSRARLISELQRIPDAVAAAIYRQRYWLPASCPAFSPPLALMHFDAAVNHGVFGAIQMLQAVVGVTVDGEVGPQTLGAIAARSAEDLIETYAETRRARYRALPHFWRFGRGWLRRVDATLALARSWADADRTAGGLLEPAQNAKGESDMSDDAKVQAAPASEDDGKWWLRSKTVWGTLITAAAAVLPALAPIFGVTLPADVIQTFGDQALTAVQAVAGLIGTILAIYGRLTASSTLTRRPLNLHL